MDRSLTPEEIADLLAAYALDAVDDDERVAIEEHLLRHPEDRDLVAELRVAGSMLAHTGGPPPEGVWERLEAVISSSPPPQRLAPPPVVLHPRSTTAPAAPRTDRRWRWLAAAAAVVALVFGGLWLADRGDGGGAADTAALARTAATQPGARHAELVDDAGNTLATAVVTPDGSGYLTSELPPAPAGHTYQLWGVSRSGTISLGVLGRSPKTVAFAASAPTSTLAITTEVTGGVPVSRNAPDAVGDIS
jgi:hypothetical protein